MKRIESFTVDHTRLNRGIYVSRRDTIGKEWVTTFDLRMKKPNSEPVLDIPALHTIEHIGATFLRNHLQWAEKTIYFGPMGCRTGFYVIFKGELTSEDVVPIVKELFSFVANFDGPIPGASAIECGNYLSQDLPMAKYEAKRYLSDVINQLKPENLNYPN